MICFKLLPLVALATMVFGSPLFTDSELPVDTTIETGVDAPTITFSELELTTIVPASETAPTISISELELTTIVPASETAPTITVSDAELTTIVPAELPTTVIIPTVSPTATETDLSTVAASATGLPLPLSKLAARQNGQVFTGDATFYTPGLGACGETDNDNSFIAAASYKLFDTFPGAGPNPNNNPICGRSLTAHANGKQVTVRITDRCAGCQGMGDLDFSPAAFQQLAPLSVGRIHGMTWSFN